MHGGEPGVAGVGDVDVFGGGDDFEEVSGNCLGAGDSVIGREVVDEDYLGGVLIHEGVNAALDGGGGVAGGDENGDV